jgi:hypothetical protein
MILISQRHVEGYLEYLIGVYAKGTDSKKGIAKIRELS